MSLRKRGQITLELLFIFGLLMVLMLYSVKNTTFSEGTPSAENLKIQVFLEEKMMANAIASSINQVYAQGPGAKATTHVKLVYLNKEQYLKNSLGYDSPTLGIYIMNATDPAINGITGTAAVVVGIIPQGNNVTVRGDNKNSVFTPLLYNYTGARLSKTTSAIKELPSEWTIVTEWNPDERNSLSVNWVAGEIKININPGG